MYGVVVSESSMNKYNILADPLGFEVKNRRQGPKTAGYRRKPAAISNPGIYQYCNNCEDFIVGFFQVFYAIFRDFLGFGDSGI